MGDARTNRLLVIGNDEQINQVKELLNLLDVDTHIRIVPYLVKNIYATDLAEQLAGLIQALNKDEIEETQTTMRSPTDSSSSNIDNSNTEEACEATVIPAVIQ